MNTRLILIIVVISIFLFTTITPLALKYFYPPKFAPQGYHVDYDNKKQAGHSIALKDFGDKHYIKLYNSADKVDVCNGETKDIISTKVCWGLKLPSNKPDETVIVWNKNGYSYVLTTNDNLSVDTIANFISNL